MELGSTEIGYVACRIVLGVLFVSQAYDKIFGLGLNQVTDTFSVPLRVVPRSIIFVSVFITSYIEFIGGGLLIIGLFTTPSLWLLALDMVLVSTGFSLIKPMWDMQHFFPRFILLLFLLVLPVAYNIISVDYLLGLVNR